MRFPVIVGDEALKFPFSHAVLQDFSGSENLAWRSEENIVQQTMLKTGDDKVAEVMTRRSAVQQDGDAVVACAGLVLECGRSRCDQGRAVLWFSFAVGPSLHIG